MKRFVIISICFICGSFTEVKDNETLIYNWDVHHKVSYYCQFGTIQEINNRGNFEIQCLRRNTGMQYILPNGVKVYPYLAFGSDVGFILKCTDIPNAVLQNCNRYVYTLCKYTCESSDIVQEARCELKGPKENITTQWSVIESCPEVNHSQSLPPDILIATVKMDGRESVTDIYNNMTDASPGANAATVSTTALIAQSKNTGIIVGCVISGVLIVGVALILLFLYKRRQKKLKSHSRSISSNTCHDVECHYENLPIMYNGTSQVVIPAISDPVRDPPSSLPEIEPLNLTHKVSTGGKTPTLASIAINSISSSEIDTTSTTTEDQDDISNLDIDKRIQTAFSDIVSLPPDIDDIKVGRHSENAENSDFEINKALDDFVSMRSNFMSWEKTKNCLDEDIQIRFHRIK